ncbi:MAG TPA: NUDIX domain-containing protein [Patescibacteria group bacterium]|nr:NUDIX domain-containing protein [Patescibacteria group bacterium]
MSAGSVEGIGADLIAAESMIPHDQVVQAYEDLGEAQARYILALDGTESEEASVIYAGVIRAHTALAEASEAMHQVSEATARYLAAIGFSGAIPGFSTGQAPAAPGESAERRTGFRGMHGDKPHRVARTEINKKVREVAAHDQGLTDIERAPVTDDQVSWDVDVPNYDPPFVDVPRGSSSARKEGDVSDPTDPNEVLTFDSLEGPVARDENGYPLNPMGRTGLAGRGILDKWGPTAAADPILTRNNPETGVLEALLIQRGDTGEWALPGGKVDPGEQPWQAAARELNEEAGVAGVDLDFAQARTVYAGYVDDSRNTDNAWMETTAVHQHLDDEQARAVTIQAGSDANAAKWVPVHEGLFPKLFAGQGEYLRLATGEVQTSYAHREQVPADAKDWAVEQPNYDPPSLTTEWVRTTGVQLGVSDPESPREVDLSTRPSFLGSYGVDDRGRPQNPTGRQGLAGRGDLAKWGPNNAADPVVVAVDPETSKRKILLIRREDTGAWALPGGMVDPGEHVSKTAARELSEEAGIDLRNTASEVVFEGYVNDPRNTDNAWIETSARLFRLTHTPEPRAGDDAAEARWFSCDTVDELRAEIRRMEAIDESTEPLYASHSEIIERALRQL